MGASKSKAAGNSARVVLAKRNQEVSNVLKDSLIKDNRVPNIDPSKQADIPKGCLTDMDPNILKTISTWSAVTSTDSPVRASVFLLMCLYYLLIFSMFFIGCKIS